MPSTQPSRRQILVEIVLIFAVFALQGAWPVPDVNEPHYLGKTIHYWNPEWLQGDFFMESPDTHKVFYFTFGWLSLWLSPTALAATGRALSWALLAWAWRRLSFAVVPRAWWAVLTAALFGCLMERCHMAGEWVIGGVEAKPFAYVLAFLGIESLVRDRWNRALSFFGAAAAFHVLVGGWASVAAGIAWLWLRAAGRDVPALKTLWPGVFVGMALALPGLLPSIALDAGVDVETVRAAHQIYVFERLPHHLTLTGIRPDFIVRILILWVFWLMLGFWSRRILRAGDRAMFSAGDLPAKSDFSPKNRPVPGNPLTLLRAFVAGAVAIAWVGTAVNAIMIFDRPLAAELLRYYWFRLADVALPMGVALEGAALLAAMMQTRNHATSECLAGELACRADANVDTRRASSPAKHCRKFAHRLFLAIAVLAAAVHLGVHAWDRLWPSAPRSHRIAGFADWQAACAWVAASGEIPDDARFITPRLAQTFKWYANRSDAATWKDVPQDARSLVEWWDRIQTIYATGRPKGPRWYQPLSAAGEQHLLDLGKRYDADYLIVERSNRPLSLEKVYENDTYAIYRLNEKNVQ